MMEMPNRFSDYTTAHKVAKQIDSELRANDFDPNCITIVLHEEGTQLIYHSSFPRKWKDWMFIFTEHHGFHVYHMSDLIGCSEYYRREIDKQQNTGCTDKCMFCGKEDKVENLIY